MRIGLVLPTSPSYSETVFQSQILGLSQSEFDVALYLNSYITEEHNLPENVNIFVQPDINNRIKLLFILLGLVIIHPINLFRFIRLEKLSGYNIYTITKHILLNSHILDQRLDWLHFGFSTMGIKRENVAKAIGAKSAVSFRGFDIGLYPYQHPNCYNLLFKRIDKVHTISDDLYNTALVIGLDPNISVEKITPAINTTFFKSNSNGDLHNPLRLLTVGRLTWKKGYEYALKALSLLKDKQINFEYHIVGEGDYREAIIYAIYQLGLTDNVILKGQLSQDNVKREMEWADIYIQPSIQEGFCNSVLEAQSMGLICVVTNAEGLSENVKHGETGWVIPKRIPEYISGAITEIISLNINQLNKIRQNAIERVRKNFDIKDYQDKWFAYYNNKLFE